MKLFGIWLLSLPVLVIFMSVAAWRSGKSASDAVDAAYGYWALEGIILLGAIRFYLYGLLAVAWQCVQCVAEKKSTAEQSGQQKN